MKSQSKVAIFILLLININFNLCEAGLETTSSSTGLELEHEIVEGQADQPESGEDFVAIHRDAVGTKEELNPQMRGLMAMAITYLPLNFKFVRVISATREVVAGVRFRLFIEALENSTSEVICAVELLEKPWIITEYGSKLRILEYANCTESGREYRIDPTSLAAAEANTKINPIFQRNNNRPMTYDRLSDLESQIVSDQGTNTQSVPVQESSVVQQDVSQIESEPAVDYSSTVKSPVNLPDDFQAQVQSALENIFNTSPEIKAAIEEISNAPEANQVQQKYEEVLERLVQVVVTRIFANPNAVRDNFSYRIPIVLNNPTKRFKSAVVYIQKEAEEPDSSSDQPERFTIDPYETTSVTESEPEVEEGSSRVKRSISGSSQAQELDVVEVKDFIASQFLDPLVKYCKDISESKTNGCFKNKQKGINTLGGWHEPQAEGIQDAKNLAKQGLEKVATGEGATCEFLDYENISSQVVSGIKYKGHVKHKCSNGEEKTCELIIYSQAWTDTLEFDWKCPEYKKYSTKQLQKRSLIGGAMEIDPTDDDVQKFGRHAVSKIDTGDGPQCEFLDILSAKRQIVSGLKYTLTIKHKCGDEEKVCEAYIWSQPWNNFTDVNWKCPETRPVFTVSRFGGHRELTEEETKDLEKIVIDALSVASEKNPNKNYNFVKITRATKQVVSGYSYNFDVEATDDAGQTVHCFMRVHVQSWKTDKHDVKMTCDDETFKFRQRRSILHHDHRDARSLTSRGEEHMRRLFDKFKLKHKKIYGSDEEEATRFLVFKQNLYKIEELNKNEEGTAKYGVTQFADLTKDEFKAYTGFVIPDDVENRVKNRQADILDIELPPSFDWREKNAVTEIKNQGQCGSCWAFSAIGNIEGQNAIKYGKLEEFSEQELVDCDTTDNGCGGGYMDDAFKAVEKLGGLEYEGDYPYEGKREKCQFNSNKTHVNVRDVVDLPKNETAIAQFLVQNGPIAVALNANAMQFYRGGVSKPIKFLCSPKQLDHGVLLVGYGTASYPRFNKELPYWIIKNSWGKRWGEQGFYRLYRGDNRCGIANMASSAIVV